MSEKMVNEKTKEELQEANYRLNRLLTKLDISTAHNDDGRYELALHEVGRLQGIEQGFQYAANINRS